MQLQFLDSVWFSLHKKEDFYITLSWFFFLLLFKLHNTKNIQRVRRRSKQGKVGAATTKKLKKMKFRVVVLWCSAQKQFVFAVVPIADHYVSSSLIIETIQIHYMPSIHPGISSMLKFAKNTHIFFQDALCLYVISFNVQKCI